MPPKQDSQNPGTNNEAGTIDLGKILLPKKEIHTPASAQRVNAGILFEQEKNATLKTETPTPLASQRSSAAPRPFVQQVGSGSQTPLKKPEEPMVQPLETYKGDIEKLVQTKNLSVISIAAAEAQSRAEAQTAAATVSSKKPLHIFNNLLMMSVGLLFVAGAVGGVLYVLLRPAPTATIPQNPQAPFISVDETRLVSFAPGALSRNATIQSLETARKEVTLSLGLMARLYPASAQTVAGEGGPQLISIQSILSTIAPNIPMELVRSIHPAYYTLGVHAFDENQAFLILRVDSYSQAYSGMLGWEKTMFNDLSPLFVRNPTPKITPLDGETESVPPVQLLPTLFFDEVVENRDVRVIKNQAGDILLLWALFDRNTIVITTNEYTLREIITRFTDLPLLPQP